MPVSWEQVSVCARKRMCVLVRWWEWQREWERESVCFVLVCVRSGWSVLVAEQMQSFCWIFNQCRKDDHLLNEKWQPKKTLRNFTALENRQQLILKLFFLLPKLNQLNVRRIFWVSKLKKKSEEKNLKP